MLQHASHLVSARFVDGEGRRYASVAKGDMQDGSTFGRVDVFAGEHGVPRLLHICLSSQLDQFGKDVVVDEVLAEVEQDVDAIVRVGTREGVETVALLVEELLKRRRLGRPREVVECGPSLVVCATV